ncbi:FGGY family carbohydrate kinase [Paracoccus indicus]|uniref:FGGY family carbohydrate kinase n=1 Tax=Paracoccus indicus TaxID=2079229 RepID=UPI001B8AC647|nr:FGGY family carbohydrate kinase [Paracoccus indicus]
MAVVDARAAFTVDRFAAGPMNIQRVETTGTGLNTCHPGAQMAHMDANAPELLDRAQDALHFKNWLYLNLTGIRATDPSKASFTFDNFRTRAYDDDVITALGWESCRHLLPPIIDGGQVTHPLTAVAARRTGLGGRDARDTGLSRHGDDGTVCRYARRSGRRGLFDGRLDRGASACGR